MCDKNKWLKAMSFFSDTQDRIHIKDFSFEPTAYMTSPLMALNGKVFVAYSKYVTKLEDFIPPDGNWYLYVVIKTLHGYIVRFSL